MQYVALFKKEKKGFGVIFPDLPECITFGDNLDEAVDQAHEALALFLEYMREEGTVLPEPTPKKALLAKDEHKGCKAINITAQGDGSDFVEFEAVMHAHLMKRIEKYCREYGVSPADFLAVASREAIRNDVFAE